ncbi:glutamate--cysteine ligase [Rosenbergiella collisarenosi]|uniref:glutamate--cysteine ligase n=1 Tax=Rosenbergiella collisarenosi TaxID=1544695 RepID=UPI001BDA9093|nr:glutamate--cysteine ligase [Rosenbergiella collisarenosi]MBT0721492.1 glutamate--cysteine ligase [Rosenbergiella collisarenosi]
MIELKRLSPREVSVLPDVTNALRWLQQQPQLLTGIGRGIERESLRVRADGALSEQGHPAALGSALTHDWIITDFAEALMEFVTPVDRDIPHLLTFLRDLHRHVAKKLGDERLWPFSIPGKITDPQTIELANYGSSNLGQMKHIYRQGLKHRYGSLMQVISGIHYNFSLPTAFWEARATAENDSRPLQDVASDGYLGLIRNYYRFGWIIPYLFGASPAVCESFLSDTSVLETMESDGQGTRWFPYATSLRLSDLGYTNKSQSGLAISFNSLDEYVAGLKQAIATPSAAYEKMGLFDAQQRRIQLNTNVLQIENELYAPIRPKRVIRRGEAPSDALQRGGIEYIEVRSLDINPFSATGISEEQVRFLDVFLVWCALIDSPDMDAAQLNFVKGNWNSVIMQGRKPGLSLKGECGQHNFSLQEAGLALFDGLDTIAQILDGEPNGPYQTTCQRLRGMIVDPESTYSGKILSVIKQEGFVGSGVTLAENYRQALQQEPLEILTEDIFAKKAAESLAEQQDIEANDTLTFEQYLASRNG